MKSVLKSMRLQLISDLHTEFYRPDPKMFCQQVEIVSNLDFLVIAGDLVVPSRQPEDHVKWVFDFFSKKARHLIYTIGNHEYYGGTPAQVWDRLSGVFPDNCHVLYNDEQTIEGQHFYGGTMWFFDDRMGFFYRRYMNDFTQIGYFEPWVYQQAQAFTLLGHEFIKPETIVVSHHLPHPKSIASQYENSQLNRFFMNDQTDLIGKTQPRLWLHGHTHTPCDYTLGNTRVVCNPHGYPNENPGPYTPVVLEV